VPVRRKGKTWVVPRAPRPPVVILPRKRGGRVPPAALEVPPPVFPREPCSVVQMLGAPPFVPPRAVPAPAPARPAPVPPKPPRTQGP
jgi:hypothetical protein